MHSIASYTLKSSFPAEGQPTALFKITLQDGEGVKIGFATIDYPVLLGMLQNGRGVLSVTDNSGETSTMRIEDGDDSFAKLSRMLDDFLTEIRWHYAPISPVWL